MDAQIDRRFITGMYITADEAELRLGIEIPELAKN
jgi:hypothetical protein